jgi:hypothetical protein
VSFVSPYGEDEAVAGATSGKDAAAGFVNLLRRTIPSSRILSVCLEEWDKSFARQTLGSRDKRERVRAVAAAQEALPARQRDPVDGYRRISQILKRRK